MSAQSPRQPEPESTPPTTAISTDRIEPGLSATVMHRVQEADTAIALGSGSVPVLATPRVLQWCEQACVEAVRPFLDPGAGSVGVQVMLDHVAPSAVGHTVTAEATLERVTGRKLFFTVSARDERGLLAAGKVVRAVVDEQRFMERCQ